MALVRVGECPLPPHIVEIQRNESIVEYLSSSINYFQCGIYYLPDGCLGRENWIYSIGEYFDIGSGQFIVVVQGDNYKFQDQDLATPKRYSTTTTQQQQQQTN